MMMTGPDEWDGPIVSKHDRLTRSLLDFQVLSKWLGGHTRSSAAPVTVAGQGLPMPVAGVRSHLRGLVLVIALLLIGYARSHCRRPRVPRNPAD